MGKNFDSGGALLGVMTGLQEGLDAQRKQKQALLTAMIQSGQYQPAMNAQPQNFMQRFQGNLMGPNLSSPTPNMLGMPFQQVTPQMQADQMKQQMAAYGNILGTFQGGNQGGYQPSFSIDPTTGRMKSISMKPPSSSSITAGRVDKQAQDILEGIKSGDIAPTLTGLGRTGLAGQVLALAAKQGVNIKKMQADWISTQTYAKNLNSSQQVRLNQAISSVKNSIPRLKDLSAEFGRTGWTPANGVELKAALTGTDPTKRDIATKYITQINLMRDETAQAFMAGGVPNESAFKLANEIFSPVYGNQQLDAALDQVDINLAIRQNAISGGQPTMIGGNSGSDVTQNTGQGKQVGKYSLVS